MKRITLEEATALSPFEQRMYQVVPYNLRGIQQGIQGGHAKDEYAEAHDQDPEFKRWRRYDKTYIVLDGGTFNSRTGGGMERILARLVEIGVKHEAFYEPDANDGLTGIAFLADERVFDRTNYPWKEPFAYDKIDEDEIAEEFQAFLRSIGGPSQYELRKLIFSLQLAKG